MRAPALRSSRTAAVGYSVLGLSSVPSVCSSCGSAALVEVLSIFQYPLCAAAAAAIQQQSRCWRNYSIPTIDMHNSNRLQQ